MRNVLIALLLLIGTALMSQGVTVDLDAAKGKGKTFEQITASLNHTPHKAIIGGNTVEVWRTKTGRYVVPRESKKNPGSWYLQYLSKDMTEALEQAPASQVKPHAPGAAMFTKYGPGKRTGIAKVPKTPKIKGVKKVKKVPSTKAKKPRVRKAKGAVS